MFVLALLRTPVSTLFPYTDALPIFADADFDRERVRQREVIQRGVLLPRELPGARQLGERQAVHRIYRVQSLGEEQHFGGVDRKSTRLNSSHTVISYAVFCLKKKKHS